jgi:hypothetical protein
MELGFNSIEYAEETIVNFITVEHGDPGDLAMETRSTMQQLTTVGQEVGIPTELREFIDQVIVPALLERLGAAKDLYSEGPVYYDLEGAQ